MFGIFKKKTQITPIEVLDGELKRLHLELRSTVITYGQFQLIMQEISKINDKVMSIETKQPVLITHETI